MGRRKGKQEDEGEHKEGTRGYRRGKAVVMVNREMMQDNEQAKTMNKEAKNEE